ncbi:hypothetical protein [Kitasatospora sp. A2-31]|uniref:hypothetical protein n=1 Tax=Kitasatospora sp. A2-31 TaxID=2916414 RepID=UPI001EEA4D7F|nr:hypothetical protein [Kitasatospora sp. A2-31]MCG6495277.1 hypothetical protein [Kitasatospora sp. A2-31]
MSESRTAVADPNALPLRRRVAAPAPAPGTAPSRAVRRDRFEAARAEDGTGRIAAVAEPAGDLALRTRAAHCRIAMQYLD